MGEFLGIGRLSVQAPAPKKYGVKKRHIEMMYLYLVERTDELDYDQFAAMVVQATSEEEARMMHPAQDNPYWWPEGHRFEGGEWVAHNRSYSSDGKKQYERVTDWPLPESLKVTLVGSSPHGEQRVILASFNVG